MFAIPFAFVLAAALPQEPAPAQPSDLEALAARVDAAHLPRGPVPPITAFRSTIELFVQDHDAEHRGQVELVVQFLRWQDPERDRTRSLIRYEVLEAGSPIVRGRDRYGPWQMFQGRAQDLNQAEFADDLAACNRNTNLARQLLRFLDPGAVLRALQEPGPVREASLRRGRQDVACRAVAGRLAAFPLLQQGGEDAPVHLEAFVDPTSGHLLSVEATPLVDGQPVAARLERVDLVDLHENEGVLVPREILHLFRKDDGKLHLQTRAVLTSLSLRPELRAEDFDRPR